MGLQLTVALVRLVVLAAVVDAVALQVLGDAEGGAPAEEFFAARALFDLSPDGLEAFGANGLVGGEEPGKIGCFEVNPDLAGESSY